MIRKKVNSTFHIVSEAKEFHGFLLTMLQRMQWCLLKMQQSLLKLEGFVRDRVVN